jgi:hypothetical protein
MKNKYVIVDGVRVWKDDKGTIRIRIDSDIITSVSKDSAAYKKLDLKYFQQAEVERVESNEDGFVLKVNDKGGKIFEALENK